MSPRVSLSSPRVCCCRSILLILFSYTNLSQVLLVPSSCPRRPRRPSLPPRTARSLLRRLLPRRRALLRRLPPRRLLLRRRVRRRSLLLRRLLPPRRPPLPRRPPPRRTTSPRPPRPRLAVLLRPPRLPPPRRPHRQRRLPPRRQQHQRRRLPRLRLRHKLFPDLLSCAFFAMSIWIGGLLAFRARVQRCVYVCC